MKTPLLRSIAWILLVGAAACSNPEAKTKKYLEQGNAAFDKGQYAEAILAYRNAIKISPLVGDAHLRLAQAYEKSGSPANAGREYVRAADLLTQSADVQLTAARYLLAAGQFEDARTRAKKAVDLDPKKVDARIVLGRAIAGTKDVPGALKEIEEAIAIAPDSASAYTSKGSLLLREGHKEEAQANFQKAVELNPRSIEAFLALGMYYWTTGSIPQADATFQKALQLEPKNAIVNQAIALLYVSSGRAAAAEPYLKTLTASLGTPEAELGLADYYLRLRRADAAKPILERLANVQKVAGPATVRLAQLDYVNGDHTSAYKRIDAVIAKTPSNSDALITKARFLIADGKVKDALAPAQAAAQADPKSPNAHFLVGQITAQLGDLQQARTSFGEVVKLSPRAAVAQTALASIHLASGSSETAVQLARDAITSQPQALEPRLLLVRGLLTRKETDRAAAELAVLNKAAPDNPAVHAMNGALLIVKKDLAGARREYERALAKDPSNVDALTGIAMLDANAGQLARSRSRVAAQLALHPKDPGLLMLAAQIDLQSGQTAEGEAKLRQVVEIAPATLSAYSTLGSLYVRQKRLEEARREFEALAKRQTNPIGAHIVLGMILQTQNKPDEAIKAYQRALDLDASTPVAANNVAYMYADRGENLDQALGLAQAAAARLPDEPAVSDTLGWVYYKRQQPVLAVTQFERSVQKAPTDPLFQYHLGLAYAGTGDADRARRALEEALRLNPSFEGADGARQTLASLKK